MLDFSVNGGSSKSWRIMCRVYYCFLTVLMLRAAWELQHHLSKGGKINEEHPDMQVINEWLQRLRDQVHHSKADSARKLIQDVMKLEEDWKKYNANRSTVRFPPEYAGRKVYEEMMKIDGNTVLDWEPAIIAKVGSVFLANDVEEDYAPMELHNMTIGMYISPPEATVRNGANAMGYTGKLAATMLVIVVTATVHGCHKEAIDTFNNYLALTAEDPVFRTEGQQLLAAIKTAVEAKIKMLHVRKMTAHIGGKVKVIPSTVPNVAPATNASSSGPAPSTHRTADLEALFAGFNLDGAVERLAVEGDI